MSKLMEIIAAAKTALKALENAQSLAPCPLYAEAIQELKDALELYE